MSKEDCRARGATSASQSAPSKRAARQLVIVGLLCGLALRHVRAQGNAVAAINVGPRVELAGSWTPIPHEWVSNDTIPVDYSALPLNDAGRTRAQKMRAPGR